MPWQSLESVPDNMKTLDGVSLTLAQANSIARVADKLEKEGKVDYPWAVARSQFKKNHKKNSDNTGWVKKESESTGKDSYFDEELGEVVELYEKKAQSGSYKVMGNLKSGGTAIQAIRYKKSDYTEERARAACTKAGGYSFAVNEGNNYYRCRIKKPSAFKSGKGNYWTQPLKGKKKKAASKILFAQKLVTFDEIPGEPYRVNIEAAREGCMKFVGADGQTYEFEISETDIDSMIDNFDKGVVGYDVNVDIEHFSEKPHKAPSPAFTESLGRVIKLWKSESDNPAIEGSKTLCATLELNKEGRRLLEEKKYRYSSVVIWRKWIDAITNEEAQGAVLSSIAFTNTPVGTHLKSLGESIPEPEEITETAIAASQWIAIENGIIFLSREQEETPNRQGGTMPRKQATSPRVLFSTVEGANVDDLKNLLRGKLSETESPGENSYLWIESILETEIGQGNVVYTMDEKKYNRPYTLSEDGSSVTFGERTEVEVKTEYVEAGTEPVVETTETTTVTTTPEIKIKVEATPLAAPTPGVTVEAASKPKGSAMNETEKKLKEMQDKLRVMKAKIAQEKVKIHFSRVNDKLSSAKAKETGKSLAPATLELFRKITDGVESVVETTLGIADPKEVTVRFSKVRETYQAEPEVEKAVEEVMAPVEEAVATEEAPEEAKPKVDVIRQVLELTASMAALLQGLLDVDLAPSDTTETVTPSETPMPESASKDVFISKEAKRIMKEDPDSILDARGRKPKKEADKLIIAQEMASKAWDRKHGGGK